MLTLENILLIIIIFILINALYKRKNEELFEVTTTNKTSNKVPIYGDIQYIAQDSENNNNFIYQNLDILDLDDDKIIDEDFIINKPIKAVENKFKKIKMPSEDEARYNIKFFQPSDIDINKPFDPTKIVYTDRKIQDVYADIVNDVKKNNPEKKMIINNSIKPGAFGENTLSDIEWVYEGDNDNNAYDPKLSNLLAI